MSLTAGTSVSLAIFSQLTGRCVLLCWHVCLLLRTALAVVCFQILTRCASPMEWRAEHFVLSRTLSWQQGQQSHVVFLGFCFHHFMGKTRMTMKRDAFVRMLKTGYRMATVTMWRVKNGMTLGSRVWELAGLTVSPARLNSVSDWGYAHAHSFLPHWQRLPVFTSTLPQRSHLRSFLQYLKDQKRPLLQSTTGLLSLRYSYNFLTPFSHNTNKHKCCHHSFQVLRRMLDSADFLEDLSGPEEVTLAGSERTLLRELADILEPFTEAWDMVHGDRESEIHTERHVSISLALPCVLGLRKHLSETSAPNCPSLVVGLTQALESWLAPILEDPLYITATTLDPQFKLTWSSNPDWHRQVLIEEINKHSAVSRPAEANMDQKSQSQTPPTPSPSPVSTLSRPCKLFSFIKQRPTMQAKSLEQELAIYLCEEPTDEEALHYWQRKAIDFPLLAQVAKRAFTIPACGTVVGSIFTTARHSLQPERGHVVPKNLETLIYLKANYRLLWT